jgi:CRISPR/Cas system CMR-associated protein Cmr3 (group 5 of RAMP superfamily)
MPGFLLTLSGVNLEILNEATIKAKAVKKKIRCKIYLKTQAQFRNGANAPLRLSRTGAFFNKKRSE